MLSRAKNSFAEVTPFEFLQYICIVESKECLDYCVVKRVEIIRKCDRQMDSTETEEQSGVLPHLSDAEPR